MATGAAAVAAVVIHDPHVAGSWGVCPILSVTGMYCPTCGGLRAVDDLAHGRLVAAVDTNVLVVGVVAHSVVVWGAWAVAGLRRTRFPYERWFSPVVVGVLAVVAVLFTVLRNLPVGSWLAP
jgi:hypothetical protein